MTRISGLTDFQSADGTGLECAILPFDLQEILLPGQKRYLHFYEERFIRLAEYAAKNHGVVAMSFFSGDNEMLRVCTLCEIDENLRLEVGIGLTVRGVARVNIENLVGVDPFIRAKVSMYNDDEEEGLETTVEELYKKHEVLILAENDAGIKSSSTQEIATDPRSLLQPGQTWNEAVAEFKATEEEKNKKKKGGDVKGRKGVKSDDSDDNEYSTSIRSKVQIARAVQTRSISFAPRDSTEERLEHFILSFLALEGSGLKKKLSALMIQSTRERLSMCHDSLDELTKMLGAKQALENIGKGI